MNILQINKFFYVKGGAARYFIELSKLLKNQGHNVVYLSTTDQRKQSKLWYKWGANFINYLSINDIRLENLPYYLARIFFSQKCNQIMSEIIKNYKINLVHIHNIYHQIPPSIIRECKKNNLPVIFTIHDYHLISVNNHMFHNGKICEITKPNKFYKGIFHKCQKDSFFYSLIEVLEKYFNLIIPWERKLVDIYITPSKFMQDKLIEYGIPSEKVRFLSHFVNYHEYKPVYKDGYYVLYFGRLSAEKGLDFLINTVSRRPEIKLKIAGTGSEEKRLRDLVSNKKIKNVQFLGFKSGNILKKIIQECKFTILPSLWYEVFGLSILESFASGKPVLASDIGGIPEIIENGYNGFLFKPGDGNNLLNQLDRLWKDTSLCRKLGVQARQTVEKKYGPEKHYRNLMKIYNDAIKIN